MPNFKYTALDQNGAEKTGFVTADNKIAAMEMVRAQGLLVRECEEAKAGAAPATKQKGSKKDAKGKKKKDAAAKGKAGGAVKQNGTCYRKDTCTKTKHKAFAF